MEEPHTLGETSKRDLYWAEIKSTKQQYLTTLNALYWQLEKYAKPTTVICTFSVQSAEQPFHFDYLFRNLCTKAPLKLVQKNTKTSTLNVPWFVCQLSTVQLLDFCGKPTVRPPGNVVQTTLNTLSLPREACLLHLHWETCLILFRI